MIFLRRNERYIIFLYPPFQCTYNLYLLNSAFIISLKIIKISLQLQQLTPAGTPLSTGLLQIPGQRIDASCCSIFSQDIHLYYVHFMVEEMEVEEYRMISPGISAPISPHYDPATLPEH